MAGITISIHQPNFFPYMGFFQKMEKSDVFVLLNHVQYEKNGYQSRFNIGNNWYTMSINRGLTPINTKRYINYDKDWQRIKNRLPEYKSTMTKFDGFISEHMSVTNSEIIKQISNDLNIKTNIVYDYKTELKGTERLVDICKHYGATKYLSGISGKKYMDTTLFEKEGIEVVYQDETTMIKKPIIEVLNERD